MYIILVSSKNHDVNNLYGPYADEATAVEFLDKMLPKPPENEDGNGWIWWNDFGHIWNEDEYYDILEVKPHEKLVEYIDEVKEDYG